MTFKEIVEQFIRENKKPMKSIYNEHGYGLMESDLNKLVQLIEKAEEERVTKRVEQRVEITPQIGYRDYREY